MYDDLSVLTRRGLLTAIGGGFVATCFGQAPAIVTSKNRVPSAGCMLAAEQTEGPYYVDQRLIRHDISEGRPGIALDLQIIVLDGLRCIPIQNAAVNIWHCDAVGVYSGYTAQSMGGPPPMDGRRPPPPAFRDGEGPPPPMHRGPQDSSRFFRGVQLTDAAGKAEFKTIYPGWYMGRDTHIHVKVHTAGSVQGANYMGGRVCHTGQLFFPEDVTDSVARLPPYATHSIERTLQQDDDIFTSQHGSDFVVSLAQLNSRTIADGFVARVVMGVDPNATPAPTGFGGPPRPAFR
jgi:protocatechuate 3,4-dioxygenase beta subunit